MRIVFLVSTNECTAIEFAAIFRRCENISNDVPGWSFATENDTFVAFHVWFDQFFPLYLSVCSLVYVLGIHTCAVNYESLP